MQNRDRSVSYPFFSARVDDRSLEQLLAVISRVIAQAQKAGLEDKTSLT